MKFKLKENEAIKQRVEKMTARELIEKVVCPNINALSDKTGDGALSVFMSNGKNEDCKKKVAEINASREKPALIVADLEFGAGILDGETKFSSLRGCAETDSESLAYEAGKITAQESIPYGYNWSLAPVVDILGSWDSPMASIRSAGETADQVIKIAGAYMRGMQDNGMIATLKHFPGDGYCKYDQHLTTPENPLSMEEWENSFGKVYRCLVNNGAIAIMPGHISLPAYDDFDKNMDMYPPATLSKKLLTNLLKNDIGFEGILISDAMNMSGICGYMNYYKACATFLEAGGDCLLFSHLTDIFYYEMEKLIEEGYLKIETLKNRAYRMMCLSEQFAKPVKEFNIDKDFNAAISRQIDDNSIKVIRNRNNIIPFNIDKETKIMHLVLTNDTDTSLKKKSDIAKADMLAAIQKHSNNVTQISDPGPDALTEMAYNKDYDLIICSVFSGASYAIGTTRLYGPVARNMCGGWTKLNTPVIFVAHGHPYLHEEFKAVMDAVINTYGHTDYTADKTLHIIVGK